MTFSVGHPSESLMVNIAISMFIPSTVIGLTVTGVAHLVVHMSFILMVRA